MNTNLSIAAMLTMVALYPLSASAQELCRCEVAYDQLDDGDFSSTGPIRNGVRVLPDSDRECSRRFLHESELESAMEDDDEERKLRSYRLRFRRGKGKGKGKGKGGSSGGKRGGKRGKSTVKRFKWPRSHE